MKWVTTVRAWAAPTRSARNPSGRWPQLPARHRPADSGAGKQIRSLLQLLHATWRLRLPPPVKECRLALEEFRCRCRGVGGT
ncbi:hypothetical protein EGJ15_09995 [Pseudomonas sp. p99-361]|nr:hypothetical protein FPB55_16265 [Pseudomonas sp. BJP69]RRV72064.1 hypothetical protein EGJ15_09995 [Pseudomonas sp. p99-361]